MASSEFPIGSYRSSATWEADQPSIYGRFDLSFDGRHPPKMLEYNADTPTSLVEAAVVQWFWFEDTRLGADQFNSNLDASEPLYLACVDDTEDLATIAYLRDTAEQAGIRTKSIMMPDIGWSEGEHAFTDLDESRIRQLFKLYPWEWLAHEQFADELLTSFDRTRWIEPAWKMLLSNKGILPILWELFPGHPNLLESSFTRGNMREFVEKPLLSREGANVRLVSETTSLQTAGDYGEEGFVYQQVAALPVFDGSHAVIGSWIVAGEAAGIGIRESDGPITDNVSRFVPHVVRGKNR